MSKTPLTIIGNGKMASALITGLEQSYDITIIARDTSKHPNHKTIPLEPYIDINDQTVLLCVKPHALADVSRLLKGKASLLISILAGSTIETLTNSIEADAYVRAMPNLGASYGASATSLTGDLEHSHIAKPIFESIGSTIWLGSEKELDIATAIAGSGPAFLALIAEALSDGGVNAGLKRADADSLTASLFASFKELIAHDKAATIKDDVMSPGGTTSAGVQTLEAHKVRSAFIEAIANAKARADKLAKS
jgi:pyrroline-5-carboxylate reductase